MPGYSTIKKWLMGASGYSERRGLGLRCDLRLVDFNNFVTGTTKLLAIRWFSFYAITLTCS